MSWIQLRHSVKHCAQLTTLTRPDTLLTQGTLSQMLLTLRNFNDLISFRHRGFFNKMWTRRWEFCTCHCCCSSQNNFYGYKKMQLENWFLGWEMNAWRTAWVHIRWDTMDIVQIWTAALNRVSSCEGVKSDMRRNVKPWLSHVQWSGIDLLLASCIPWDRMGTGYTGITGSNHTHTWVLPQGAFSSGWVP